MEARSAEETVLTVAQTMALAIVPKISASFSIIGSGWIMLEVWGDKAKQKLVYHRLLAVFSFVDTFASLWYFASSWPMPRGTENAWHAFGNATSCTAQGFFIQLSSALFVYNAVLTIYFVLVISYNVKEEVLKRNEVYLHAIPMAFGFATAIAGLPLELYNEANVWCWIARHPDGCEGNDCIRGEHAFLYRWVFFYGPLWGCFAIVAVGLYSVYRGVRKQELKLAKYDPSRRRPKKSSVGGARAEGSAGRSSDGTAESRNGRRSSTIVSIANNISGNISQLIARGLSLDSYGIDTPRARQVASQAVMYVVAFYLTYFFSSWNRVSQVVYGQSPYWIKLLQGLFQPLQGTWNFLIYRRPIFLRIRRNDPDLSTLKALKRTMLFSPTHSWRRQRPRRQPPPEINVHYTTTGNNNNNYTNGLPVIASSLAHRIETVRESLRTSPMTSTEKQLIELEEMEVVGFSTRIDTDAEHWLAEYNAGHTQDEDRPYSHEEDGDDGSSSEDEEPPTLCRDGTMRRSGNKTTQPPVTNQQLKLSEDASNFSCDEHQETS